ncbi:MAG: adenylate kinase [Clostridiales bacterium]|nr:adenylate kinase [Clostridiales bacterium]
MKLILLGAPGSGKGTQAAYISDKYDLPHISTGDIFRENIKKQTPLGLKVKEIMDSGNFCPNDVTVELVKDRLKNEDCKKGYLLDGFPRNLFQAEALDEFCSPDLVINLEVDLNKIERRITGRRSCPKCGNSFHVDFIGNTNVCPDCGETLIIRKDDNVETVKERLHVYSEQTAPLIDFYTKQGKLVSVDGDKTIDEVFEQIVKVLG